MFLRSLCNEQNEDMIGDTGFSTIALIDTHFQAIISPTERQIRQNPAAFYAAHVFKEYINHKIPPVRNYLLYIQYRNQFIPIRYYFIVALVEIIGPEEYQKYNNCLYRLEREMKNVSY